VVSLTFEGRFISRSDARKHARLANSRPVSVGGETA
jgi:hypothetical protein